MSWRGRGYRFSLFRTPSLFGKVVGRGLLTAGKSVCVFVCVCGLRIDRGGAGVWRSGSCSFNEPPSFKTKPKKKQGVTDTGPCGTPRGLDRSCANLCWEFKKNKNKKTNDFNLLCCSNSQTSGDTHNLISHTADNQASDHNSNSLLYYSHIDHCHHAILRLHPGVSQLSRRFST